LAIKINFDHAELPKLFDLDFPNLKLLGIHVKEDINIDPDFLIKCLKRSKSLRFLRLASYSFYRQELSASNPWYRNPYHKMSMDDFETHFQIYVEKNDFLRFTPYCTNFDGIIYLICTG